MNEPRCNCSPESDHVGNVYHQRHCAMLPRLRGLSAARGGDHESLAALLRPMIRRVLDKRHDFDVGEMAMMEAEELQRLGVTLKPRADRIEALRQGMEHQRGITEHFGAARGGAPAPDFESATPYNWAQSLVELLACGEWERIRIDCAEKVGTTLPDWQNLKEYQRRTARKRWCAVVDIVASAVLERSADTEATTP